MENNVVIAEALNGNARVYLFDSKEMVEKARTLHDLWPTSCAALGRTLAVTALMGLMQKEKGETVTVTINGNGPIGTILCVADCEGNVKGFCGQPHIYQTYENTHKLAVGLAVGTDGYLKVTKNLRLKQNYTSQVKLQSGEIGDDFAYFFVVSEQIPCIVSVGVLVDKDDSVRSSGAMIIQLLPGHKEEDIEYLEKLDLKPISSVFDQGTKMEDYLYELFPDAKILEERSVRYHCDCSKERFLSKLLTLSIDDLKEIAQDDSIDVKCEFCDKEYHFDHDDIKELMNYVSDQR
ncbi:MAG: Hsp33 family molecular chaperone HslO [Erysipelotrichaceae bacterium]|nr:Hsp33 family molecular chaperone HslO [Erysipelotrichaceae bacterium]